MSWTGFARWSIVALCALVFLVVAGPVIYSALSKGGANAAEKTVEKRTVEPPGGDHISSEPTAAERYLMGQGAQITKAFMSESGLKAIVADNGRKRQLFYVAPNGKYLISGTIYDSVGGNVTSNDVVRGGIVGDGSVERLSDAEREVLWSRIEKLNWIAEGSGDRIVYVVFDPTCPYCHALWTKIQVEAKAGHAQVRWLPVAILSEESKNLAAAIYQSKDASAALHAMGDRTLTPVAVQEETIEKLNQNVQLLRASGYTGVPTILYRDGKGVQITMEGLNQPVFDRVFK
ncbi:thiol:disulfide interchange protein DsbG [Xanthomonas euvesicatoria]